jgi:hypothetical protein
LIDDIRIGSPKRKNKQVPLATDSSSIVGNFFNFKGKESTIQNKNELYIPLAETLDLDWCPEEWHHEYVYSKLLENMMPLINSIFNDKTKWRIQELFIRKLGRSLEYFNPSEI